MALIVLHKNLINFDYDYVEPVINLEISWQIPLRNNDNYQIIKRSALNLMKKISNFTTKEKIVPNQLTSIHQLTPQRSPTHQPSLRNRKQLICTPTPPAVKHDMKVVILRVDRSHKNRLSNKLPTEGYPVYKLPCKPAVSKFIYPPRTRLQLRQLLSLKLPVAV